MMMRMMVVFLFPNVMATDEQHRLHKVKARDRCVHFGTWLMQPATCH